jgi:HK97 family phage prohead protease
MPNEPRRVSGMSPQIEKRSADVEMRVSADSGAPVFAGRAVVYNTWTEIGDARAGWGFFEQIEPGAVSKTIQEADIRMLVDHNSSLLVARKSAGDIRFRTSDLGLEVEADLDMELSYVRDMARNLEKRRLSGMSYAFQVVRDSWDTVDVTLDGKTFEADQRSIQEMRLSEVSVVTFPAFPTTEAGLRSMVSEIRSARIPNTAAPSQDSPSAGESTEVEPSASADATRERMRIITMRSALLKARYNLS